MSQMDEMAAFAEFFKNPPRTGDALLRASAFREGYTVRERDVEGVTDCFMTTVEKNVTKLSHIFFLHGGGNELEATMHKDLMECFADRGFRVTAIAYPLAPEHQYEEQNEGVYRGFMQLTREYPEDSFAIFGDSCGALLGLELSFRLRREGSEKTPVQYAFVSPYTDVSLSNPMLLEAAKVDKTLPLECLQICSRVYAPKEKWFDPMVSAIYAPLAWFKGMGEFLIFYSNMEILYPDEERLIARLREAGDNTVVVYRADGQPHDYILQVDIPESKIAIEGIACFLK